MADLDPEERAWLAKDEEDRREHKRQEELVARLRDDPRSFNMHDEEQLARHLREDHGLSGTVLANSPGHSLWDKHYWQHYKVAPLAFEGWGVVHKHTERETYGLGEEITTCPQCGARTEFTDNPDGSQDHDCLNPQCGFRFRGIFDDESEED